jgi:hypothetical protein
LARTVRAPQVVVSSGLAGVYTPTGDNVNGETVVYNGRRVLHCKNTTAGSINVTVRNPTLVDGQAAPDRVVAIPATTGDKVIGLQSAVYLQSDGTTWIDYSATGLSVACYEV